MMNWLAHQPYYKIERRMNRTEQETIVHERSLYLYADQVISFSRQFPIQDVFDMSYRSMGEQEGLLYLHTKIGVYSYHLKDNPATFIESYRQLQRPT